MEKNVSDIDYDTIKELADKVDKLARESHTNLAKPFLESIPKMFLSADKMSSAVGGQITSVQNQALTAVNAIFESILKHEKNVQNMQLSEKPSDFLANPIPDLREKIATGFPREDPAFFIDVIPLVKY